MTTKELQGFFKDLGLKMDNKENGIYYTVKDKKGNQLKSFSTIEKGKLALSDEIQRFMGAWKGTAPIERW